MRPTLNCERVIEGVDWDWAANPGGKVPCEVPRMLSDWVKEHAQLIQIRRDREDGSTTYRYCTYMEKKRHADTKLCLEFDIPPTEAAGGVATLQPPANPKNKEGVFLDNEGKALNTITIEKLIKRFAWDFPSKAIDISSELIDGTELHTWESLMEFLGGTDMWSNPKTVQNDYCYSETFFHKRAAYEQAKRFRQEGYNSKVIKSSDCPNGNYHVYKTMNPKRDPRDYGQRARPGTSPRYHGEMLTEAEARHRRYDSAT